MKLRKANRGFSMLEVLMTLAFGALIFSIGLPRIQSALRQAKADAALNTVMMQFRMARQLAVDQRRIHRVTAVAPRDIKLERKEISGAWNELVLLSLPVEFTFSIEPGLPTEESYTPDGMGASLPINFDGSSEVYFHPEGSATNDQGAPVNGIVYLSHQGYIESARAVTLFGSTGRIKGWLFQHTEEAGWAWGS